MRLFNSGLQTARGERERPLEQQQQQQRSNFFAGGGGGGANNAGAGVGNSGGGGGGGSGMGGRLLPTLKQLFPGATQNFGVRQGEGILSAIFSE